MIINATHAYFPISFCIFFIKIITIAFPEEIYQFYYVVSYFAAWFSTAFSHVSPPSENQGLSLNIKIGLSFSGGDGYGVAVLSRERGFLLSSKLQQSFVKRHSAIESKQVIAIPSARRELLFVSLAACKVGATNVVYIARPAIPTCIGNSLKMYSPMLGLYSINDFLEWIFINIMNIR